MEVWLSKEVFLKDDHPTIVLGGDTNRVKDSLQLFRSLIIQSRSIHDLGLERLIQIRIWVESIKPHASIGRLIIELIGLLLVGLFLLEGIQYHSINLLLLWRKELLTLILTGLMNLSESRLESTNTFGGSCITTRKDTVNLLLIMLLPSLPFLLKLQCC